jgi:acetylornithine deacetylase/succinyl-diaminopimelate desuccinylase-like protein
MLTSRCLINMQTEPVARLSFLRPSMVSTMHNPARQSIQATTTGKFSIRLVPNLTLEEVTKLVCDYVNAEFAKINTKSKMTVEMVHGGEPWVVSADPA